MTSSTIPVMLSKPAVQQAYEYLKGQIAEGRFAPGTALPNLTSLAVAAGVSRGSVWQAVGQLKALGLVVSRRGSRLRVSDVSVEMKDGSPIPSAASSAIPDPSTSGWAWQRFHNQLLQAILQGKYLEAQRLPNRSQLAAEFGVSYRTVRKGLAALNSEGIITSTGLPIRPKRHSEATGITRIDLIGLANLEGEFEIFSPRLRAFVKALETECFQSQVNFDRVGFRPQRFTQIWDKLCRRDADGVILWLGDWVDRFSVRDQVTSLIRHLAVKGKRVIVVDEMGNLNYPKEANSQSLRILKPAARRAGYDLGLHLLKQGHRHIVWISPYERHIWSQQRRQGLVAAFTEAGYPQGVSLSVREELFDAQDLAIAFCGGKPEWLEQIFNINRSNYNAKFSASYIRETRERLNPKALPPNERVGALSSQNFRDILKRIEYWRQNHFSEQQLAVIRDASLGYAAKIGFQNHVYDLLQAALKIKKATAWVGANDNMAASIHDFLSDRNKRLAQDISVAGFDNTSESLDRHLTTYDFCIEVFAREAIDFCLNRPEPTQQNQLKIHEVKGVVLARASTLKYRVVRR